jgi:hypothetical protein
MPRLGNTGMYSRLDQVAKFAPALLGGLALFSIVGLLVANWYLSKSQALEASQDLI